MLHWKQIDDPDNRQNKNAGNGGDLVKHTVYLATIRYLLHHRPWSEGLHLRECHAGRGMYRITDDRRRRNLAALYSEPVGHSRPTLLQRAQHGVLTALGCWPEAGAPIDWYAGSALINASALTDNGASNSVDLYERMPATRLFLRAIVAAHGLPTPISIPPREEQEQEFDGEDHVRGAVGKWGGQDLILLDPFAIWRQRDHQVRRDLYGAILDSLIGSGDKAPALILFWTWGDSRACPIAKADLTGEPNSVRNGYPELRARLSAAGLCPIVVTWRWDLQLAPFAMWIVVPSTHVAPLAKQIDTECRLLTDHLTGNGYAPTPSYPQVGIA